MPKQSVAIIGASADPAKYGNKAVRAYLRRGWTVYPVSPRGGEIEGLTVFKSIVDVQRPIDRISMYVAPPVGMAMLNDLAGVGAGEVYFNPGSESDELIEAAREKGLEPIVACSIIEIGERP